MQTNNIKGALPPFYTTLFWIIFSDNSGYKPLPVIRQVDNGMVQRNYLQIKQDVEDFVSAEMERMMGDPGLMGLVVRK